jgi:16S rRNA G1207 methylase RsmC
MISPFIVNDKNLFLERFPASQVNRSLQAWDAVDEYLVNYLEQQELIASDTKLLVMNDDFGSITLNYSQSSIVTVTDSYISQLGLNHNIEQNNVRFDSLQQFSSLNALPAEIDIILYKIPKNKTLLVEQLTTIKNTYHNKKVCFIAGDKAKNIHTSTLKLFEKYLGTTSTSLAVKKARLVFSNLDNKTSFNQAQNKRWLLENTDIEVNNMANVFAREKLDIGARLFIDHIPPQLNDLNIIDLGCGNGVIGLSVLHQFPDANVHFIDESYMAVCSSKENVSKNFPDSVAQCQFSVNDCLTGLDTESVDLILCNPPFHQQNAVTDHIAWQMFRDSYRVLKKGGELRIVGNRQLGYHIKLQRLFGNEKLIASSAKFVVHSAIKS